VRVERNVDVNAPAERVWAVLADVARWPEWTDSIDDVRLHTDSLRVGSTAAVKQPRLPRSTWLVTEVEPGRGFTWVSRSGGVTTRAEHAIEPAEPGCRVRLTLDQSGLLAPLVGALFGRLTRRYVDLEADGLKRRCEQPA
jgi:uncharacterized membrane protein